MVDDHPASESQTLARRNRELSILNAIAEALNGEVDLIRALRTMLKQVADLLDLQTSWIHLFDDETGKPYTAAMHNLPPALTDSPRKMTGTCHCIDTYLEGDLEGAANINVIKCSRLEGLVDGTDGLRYHSSIPLYAHGKQLGILNVASSDWRELSTEDLRLLYTIGDLLSIAIERARLFAQSRQFGVMEERNRLAREIHDTLAQGLTAITLQLETADALLDGEAQLEQIQAAVRRALDLTRSNLEEARRSVLDLRAAPLEDRTLVEALGELVEEMTAGTGIETTFEAVGGNRPLAVRYQVGLYRIAQEALNNVLQHAEARSLQVQLVAMHDHVQLIVEDDGRGFDPESLSGGRFGLVGLNERVRLLGGEMSLQSSPNAGTRLEVNITLETDR